MLVLLCSAMIGETLSLPLELCKGILGRKRRSRVGYGTKGKKRNPAKAFEVLDGSICLFESEAESLFKMHQMFECEVRSWQHLWFSVETSAPQFPRRYLYSHEKGLIQRPSRSGTMWSWSRQVVSARSCEVSAARPRKIRVGRALGF